MISSSGLISSKKAVSMSSFLQEILVERERIEGLELGRKKREVGLEKR